MSLPHSAALAAVLAPTAGEGFALSVRDYEDSLEDRRGQTRRGLHPLRSGSAGRAGHIGRIGAGAHRPYIEFWRKPRNFCLGAEGQPVAAVCPCGSCGPLPP